MFSKHVSKQLSAYHHGELDTATRQRVAAHLAACARCQAESEQVAFGAQLMTQLARQTEQPPARLWDDLNEQWRRDCEAFDAEARRMVEAARQHGPMPPRLKFALAAACVLFLLVAGTVSWRLYRKATAPSWQVETLAGLPRIGKQLIQKAGKLRVGEWLETDQTASARINVGIIGHVEIEPNSQVQLVEAHATEHRLALQRGKLTAVITAPPRFFFVNTPSATAVDLGCAYTLEVDESGTGTLRVIAGWVAFEERGIESFVPEEALCVTRPRLGPGTPFFEDAPAELQAALAHFDIEQTDAAARATALDEVLRAARERDGLTLWHLLARTRDAERGRVFDRFAALIPPPPEVTRDGILRGERGMRDAWWEKLELGSPSFWRFWKGPVPSIK